MPGMYQYLQGSPYGGSYGGYPYQFGGTPGMYHGGMYPGHHYGGWHHHHHHGYPHTGGWHHHHHGYPHTGGWGMGSGYQTMPY